MPKAHARQAARSLWQAPGQAPWRAAGGFTLIELLVVVAILTSVSLLAFGVSSEDRAQIRYDDTRERLKQLRSAILGQLGPAPGKAIGGFVADNGDLPGDLATLLQRGSLVEQAVVSPQFDPQPVAASCAGSGSDVITLSDNAALLVKGHRGDYLGGLAFNGRFRDGWGNESADASDDARNFGWSLAIDSSARSLAVSSLGADNAAGGDDYASDHVLNVTKTDWLVPLQGISVTVVNFTQQDIAARNLSISLLVFRNNSSGGEWLRYSTPIAASTCLDGTGDGLVNGISCSQSLVFSFDANCKAGDSSSGPSWVPQGQHLLLLTAHSSANLWDGSDAIEHDRAGTSTKYRYFTRVNLVPGQRPADIRMELR
ncbi:type II secretion system protein [Rhodocyclus tenuis]|uniref:type II secretion system protein n=1 Tax=Rhodocyclus tenuis TaxID=1066 RepID=UPI001908CE3E|nr:prepilin-type N-terminal cleavage/methylation domain-containing protein [Rhodocyclus tenuis]MBK1680874.1 hypothetical protein [Rhodocyclus tenuis]